MNNANKQYSSEADKEVVRNLEGIYTGILSEDELDSLDRCIKDGYAYISFEGIQSLLGLSKVRIR
jgi:hypothetical protein